jgi:predicted acylesterase/phospholipase RssA
VPRIGFGCRNAQKEKALTVVEKALVLNAASSWGAYQVGALRHLVGDMGLHFDLCAGTGIGAMNAALVACGELDALEEWWANVSLRRLVSPNWRAPWRRGPVLAAPQRRFLASHVSERKLRERGTRLMLSTLDLQSGEESAHIYPGGDLPLLDALMAAISTPGLYPPLRRGGRQLVSATLANNYLLPKVLRYPFAEVFVVAAIISRKGVWRRYDTALSALHRNVLMNQAHDVRQGLADAQQAAQADAAFRHVTRSVPGLADRIEDADVRERLRASLGHIYAQATTQAQGDRPPVVRAITPSRELDFPVWRFRAADLAAAFEMGYKDACAAISGVVVR